MDAVREALAKFGNAWNNNIPPTLMQLYEPLQAQQNQKYGSDIKAEKAIKYGPDARNRIDVYSPASGGVSGKPVVLFIHGGGLNRGDNDVTPNVYANIGNYFTKHGYITCLATYRLAGQGGHHPNGAQDVAAALEWIRDNISRYGGDPSKVVAMGQSAGGYHLFTAMVLGYLDKDASKPLLRGAVSLSAPFTVGVTDPARVQVLTDWFATDKVFEVNGRFSPLALFRQQLYGTAGTAPREKLPCGLLVLVGEFEADEILEGTWEFVAEYKKRFGKLPLLEVMEGHNHVSYGFGLGLEAPEYEKTGRRLVEAVREFTQ